MQEQMFVEPGREGLLVPMPPASHVYLPPEGAWVPRNTYWTRRLWCGDVREIVKHNAQTQE